MRKFPALILASLALFFLLWGTKTVFAQDFKTPVSPGTDLAAFAQASTLGIIRTLNCQLTGVDPSQKEGGCLEYNSEGKLVTAENSNGGLIGFVGGLIGLLYTPPASGVNYLTDVGKNLGIVQPAYAQGAGTGFIGLRPIMELWKAFRNAAYMFFILIFLITGLLMMFRVKMNPQTVISIQNALPGMIISLILITFSYAIAGFLIDLMYLVMFALISLFQKSGVLAETSQFAEAAQTQSVINLILGGEPHSLVSLSEESFKDISAVISGVIGGPSGLGTFIGWIVGSLAFLIFMVALLWAVFRLFFALLMAYVSIILNIIFAPVALVLNAFPGGSGMFIFRNIVGGLLAFPLTLVMILLAAVFTGRAPTDWGVTPPEGLGEANFWIPPLLILKGVDDPARILSSLIGLGLILMAPRVVEMAKDAVKIPAGKGYGTAIGQALGVGVRVPVGTGTEAYKFKEKREMKGLWREIARGRGQREQPQ